MFQILDSFDTELCADSVEWCPAEHFRDHFVCGTYQLSQDETSDVKKGRKFGSIYLMQVVENAKLAVLQQLQVAAVLDMKWAHAKWNNRILLGVANSAGYLEIFELLSNDGVACLTSKWKIRVQNDQDHNLVLSLDWSTGKRLMEDDIGNEDLKIAVSDSTGCISVFKVREEGIERVSSWAAHEFEAWIVAFDYWDTNVLYSGGDDCKFQRFDFRLGKNPTLINRVHEAGVTSLHSNAKNEYSLISGSYDEILRTWDTRNFKRPLGEVPLGGGIWRVKWEPFDRRFILAACMHGGFRVVDGHDPTNPRIFAVDDKSHKSIVYGCDWSMMTIEDIQTKKIEQEMEHPTLVATCSFYDHSLVLSALQLEDCKKDG